MRFVWLSGSKGAFVSGERTFDLLGRYWQLVGNVGEDPAEPCRTDLLHSNSSAQELRGLFCICPCLMPWILVSELKRHAAKMRKMWIGVVLKKLMPTLMAGCKFNNKLSTS